jgi:hypothetical protein
VRWGVAAPWGCRAVALPCRAGYHTVDLPCRAGGGTFPLPERAALEHTLAVAPAAARERADERGAALEPERVAGQVEPRHLRARSRYSDYE